MENQLLSTEIKRINELHNKDSIEKIIFIMQPLLKKYIRKLYFMESEDAAQELTLTLIEAIYHLKTYKNEAMCLSYFQKAVINKYNYLCKKNIRTNQYFNNFIELSEEMAVLEDFKEIELYIYLDELIRTVNDRKKQIMRCFIRGLNDTETSSKLKISRQYVNRFRRELKEEIRNSVN